MQAGDLKLIQYLNEAYGKEKELETALQLHIGMTTRAPYKKRLQQHLKETKAQAKGLEQRIKKLGGKAERVPLVPPGAPEVVGEAATAVASVASKAAAAATGQLHVLRGTGEADKMLHNAKTEYHDEHQEIANYVAIETLAEQLGDQETAKLAREYRRQEERMANFLEKQIPVLTKQVARSRARRSPPTSARSRSGARGRVPAGGPGASSRPPRRGAAAFRGCAPASADARAA
jgi:ferritin-like metal-binding protein YciE